MNKKKGEGRKNYPTEKDRGYIKFNSAEQRERYYIQKKLSFYQKNNIKITFRLRDRPEYFFSGMVLKPIKNHIILELESKEKALIFIGEIESTSIHPSSINPIQYFERKTLPEWKKEKVFERCQELCELKLKGCTVKATEIDHWIPISRGGTDDLLNLRGSCSNCNKTKTNKLWEEITSKGFLNGK